MAEAAVDGISQEGEVAAMPDAAEIEAAADKTGNVVNEADDHGDEKP